jgi:hypothetical protein
MSAQLVEEPAAREPSEATAPGPGSAFVRNVLALLERTEYRRCESGEDLEAIYRLRYRAYRAHGLLPATPEQMTSDAYDDMSNSYRFGVFVDHELISTIRIHHISLDEPYGPAMSPFGDVLRPRLLAGESFINPTMFVSEPDLPATQRAVPYLTLRLGFIAMVYFNATNCLGVAREEHTAFYNRVFGAVQVGEPRSYPPFKVPVKLYDSNCAENSGWIIKRFPFFKSTPVERRMLFAKPAERELAPLTILPTAKFQTHAA